ncbi:MAG TPA: hypothetical protein VFG71_13970 [Nitrospiraceae bacterium]|nr:hypothetical protein [Nitrospiraceae bacterium]
MALMKVSEPTADSGAVPVVRKAKRDYYPNRDGSCDLSHHGQHRLGAPFVSQAVPFYSSQARPLGTWQR